MDAFASVQAVEAAVLTDEESAALATGRVQDGRAMAFEDRGC